MPDDLSTVVNAGITLTLGGKDWMIRPLGMKEIGLLQAYVRSAALRAYRDSVQDDPTVSRADRARTEQGIAFERVSMLDLFPQPTPAELDEARSNCPSCNSVAVKELAPTAFECQTCKHQWTAGLEPDPVIAMRTMWYCFKGQDPRFDTIEGFEEWFRTLKPEELASINSVRAGMSGNSGEDADPTTGTPNGK